MLDLNMLVVLYTCKQQTIQYERGTGMKQQTTQDNSNSEILNVATLSEDERVRTVVNEAIQVQIIRSDVGYIVDILDANGELIETNTVWDDDLENDENED